MCGIIGAAGNITNKIERLFATMLYLDTIRGEHSTGVCIVNRNAPDLPRVVKRVGPPTALLNSQAFKDSMMGIQGVLIGHNRFATKGEINEENAHPFIAGDVVGVHNGTLTNTYELKGHEKFNTDSELLYNMINEQGVKDAVGQVRGAYALVFYNKKEHTLNFLRNKERPLTFCLTKDKNTALWASEAWMIEIAAMRTGVEIQKIYSLKEDTHITIPITGGDKLGRQQTETVKGAPPKVYPTYHYYSASSRKYSTEELYLEVWGKIKRGEAEFFRLAELQSNGKSYGRNILCYVNSATKCLQNGDIISANVNFTGSDGFVILASIEAVSFANDDVKSEQKAHDKCFLDYFGNRLTRAEYEHKYQYCAWCSSDINADDDNVLFKNGDAICPSCAKQDDVAGYIGAENGARA